MALVWCCGRRRRGAFCVDCGREVRPKDGAEWLLNHCMEQVANFEAKGRKQRLIAGSWRRRNAEKALLARFKAERYERVATAWADREGCLRILMKEADRWSALAEVLKAIPPGGRMSKTLRTAISEAEPKLELRGSA